ncbi:MAG TPA: ACP S-malonyltransferase [Blastocatellia bacterium]|nr:ACP S-malonyltransferase [Blastocatellia bacterium]
MSIIRILLDHDSEGCEEFLKTALKETGWNNLIIIEFFRLVDFGLAIKCNDREIWRRVQEEQVLFITRNRNREDESSLQAVIENENREDSLPVLTIVSQERLAISEYRQLAAHKLAEIILCR